MKLHALLLTTLLGAMTLAGAQNDTDIQTAPEPSRKGGKAGPAKDPTGSPDGGVSFVQVPGGGAPANPTKTTVAKDPNMNADGSVTLSAGTLENVVGEIERRISHWTPKPASGDWVMPNLLYAGDTRAATVPGALTLRGVSPLQAVTLAAAAADCTLEPIYATKEEPSLGYVGEQIIGYRVLHEKEAGWDWTRAFGKRPGAQQTSPTQTKAPDPAKNSFDSATAQGLYTSSARNTQQYATSIAANVPTAVSASPNPPATVEEADRLFVRVYALGAILGGSKEEIATKQDHLKELVRVALEKSESDTGRSRATYDAKAGDVVVGAGTSKTGKTAPELSFHLELRALIVRGTTAQHEIFEQVIKVLKENETQQKALGQ